MRSGLLKQAGGCPAVSHFLLLAQKKVTKEEGHPLPRPCGVPCAARQAGRLRNSGYALRQSSPKTPGMSEQLGEAEGEVLRGSNV